MRRVVSVRLSMPTYHYICEKCGSDFEVFQSIAESALSICPKNKCARKTWGKGRVRRQISGGAGLLFKGSGFYITDYRSEGYKSAAKKDSESSAPKKESSSPAKTETKPAKATASE